MQRGKYLRDVRYDYPAQSAIDDALERCPRTADATQLLEWIIVHDPLEGKALTESGETRTLTLPGYRSLEILTVTFVYQIDDKYITIRSARFDDAQIEGKA